MDIIYPGVISDRIPLVPPNISILLLLHTFLNTPIIYRCNESIAPVCRNCRRSQCQIKNSTQPLDFVYSCGLYRLQLSELEICSSSSETEPGSLFGSTIWLTEANRS